LKPTSGRGDKLEFFGLSGTSPPPPRIPTTIAEFDRVLGGGLVPASVVLVGGDPGIGKSTLLLQAGAALGRAGKRVLYISGEESIDQIRLRALRLGLTSAPMNLAAATQLGDILESFKRFPDTALVVIDSIQTMWTEGVDSTPGSVTQVRAAAFELIRAAKTQGFALMLVGHVTKDQFRILRGVKNRFGATDEIGVFEMTGGGLAEVANPSALFLAERRGNVSGSAVFAGLEGSRPVLVEIQVLLAPNPGGSPRRSVIGWDSSRLSMLLAVLETRCGLKLAMNDVYLNVAGGLRVTEPAADMAVAAALISAATDVPTDPEMVFFGEIGLSGELRQVAQAELRLKEAAKLGFARAACPKRVAGGANRGSVPAGLALAELGHLTDLVAVASGGVKRPGNGMPARAAPVGRADQ
jgi:DNA repair protein RadA/Sms